MPIDHSVVYRRKRPGSIASGAALDEIKAKELEDQLRGSTINGWTIEHLVDHGKSAAVFRASGAGGIVAVKVFDDELIARYGDDTQFERINRELLLIDKSHPNLVKILGGGVDAITKNHFIVMEYLEGKNIKKCLSEIPANNIARLISQLAVAARFLEELGFVHRDIKPENIILLDNFTKLVLLDLGVVRPLAGSTLTDDEGIQVFIGTLQYSSPEFLLRQEEDSIDGWRSLTFYQIGGVLHDLIMRKSLFADFTQPYARLVNAVQHEAPEIQNSAIPYYLVELARCCLLKNWKMRLKFVNWASFNEPEKDEASANSFKQRVTNRGELTRAQAAELSTPVQENAEVARRRLQREALDYMKAAARTIRAQNAVLPPLQILANTPNGNSFGIQFGISPSSGLSNQLTILIEVTIIEVSARLIQVLACGWLGAFEKAAPSEATFQLVFQGTYDAPALYAVLEQRIYDLIDQVQQSAEGTAEPVLGWLKTRESC